MDIILKQDIKDLGYKNDIIVVKPGYARNYLIPQGYAIIANGTNRKVLAENLKQAAHKAEKLLTEAQALGEKIAKTSIEIKTKVGDSGKIFGAVTTLQLSDALKENGIDVDRKKIGLKVSIKEVGEYIANIDLHKTVKVELKFSVVGE